MALILEVCQPILWCTISLKKREKKQNKKNAFETKKTTMPNFCWIPFCFALKPRSSKPLTCRWLLLMMPLPSFPSPVLRSINTSTGGCGAWSTTVGIKINLATDSSIPRFSWCDSYDFLLVELPMTCWWNPMFCQFCWQSYWQLFPKKTTGSAHEAHPILQLVMFIRRMRTQCINGTTPGWSSYNHQVLSTTYSQISFKKSYMSWWNPWFQP